MEASTYIQEMCLTRGPLLSPTRPKGQFGCFFTGEGPINPQSHPGEENHDSPEPELS